MFAVVLESQPFMNISKKNLNLEAAIKMHFGYFFFFFKIRKEPTTKHPKENSLNLGEDL